MRSLPYLLLKYLHQKFPNTPHFPLSQVWQIQKEAQEHYLKNLPFDPTTRVQEIAQKHGFTHDEWKQVLSHSGAFWFLPTQAQNDCNNEIKAMFKGHDHIERTAGSTNYLACCFINATKLKRPKITRTKIDGTWYYYIIQRP